MSKEEQNQENYLSIKAIDRGDMIESQVQFFGPSERVTQLSFAIMERVMFELLQGGATKQDCQDVFNMVMRNAANDYAKEFTLGS